MSTGDSQNAAVVTAGGSIIGSVIDAVVSVYQTERNIRENRERDQKQRQFQKELEELRYRNQQQLDQESFVRQKLLQEELAAYNRQTQLQIAAEQRKTALESVEAKKLFENWPLRIVPSLILNSHRGDRPIPLRIIPVPPVVDFDRFTTKAEEFPPVEKYLAEGLRQFLHQNYSLNNTLRPVELLDGAWDSNRYHGGSSIKALFSMLQSEPILILESEIDGDYLNFRLGYWELGQKNYSYAPVITRLPFREIIYESAKTRAKKWKTARDKIVTFVEKVGECLTAIGDKSAVSQSKGLSAIALAKQGNYHGAIAAVEQAIKLNPNDQKIQDFRQQLPKSAGSYQFDVITVNSRGQEIKREKGEAQYFSEDLGNGVTLDMVAIPQGTFMMGSPEGEGFDKEKPQHQVTVPPFFMGKYPITQAQWKAIASRSDLKVEIDLDLDPSRFKGDNRPVERVSWYDAVEFCARLSQLKGREYRLPSEAEWEYACRANPPKSPLERGTSDSPLDKGGKGGSPFHFGKTITTDLANYDGEYTYADEPKGEYRKKTTPVGEFPPNAFGLYDMHGNVWNWCADPWHQDYNNAPDDGSVWDKDNNDNRYQNYPENIDTLLNDSRNKVIRGGSWSRYPFYCRSACRDFNLARAISGYGFRVVCG